MKFSDDELAELRAAAARRWPNGKAAGFFKQSGSVGEYIRLAALRAARAEETPRQENAQQSLPIVAGGLR